MALLDSPLPVDPLDEAILELDTLIEKHLSGEPRHEGRKLILRLLDADIARSRRNTEVLEEKNEQILHYQTLCGFGSTGQN